MTTSPEALREAVERLTASANGENQLTIGRNVFVQMTDLTLVLSALQEEREALRLARDFAEQEIECRGYAGGEKTDYQDEAQKVFDACDAVLFRCSSGRALSPGGADA